MQKSIAISIWLIEGQHLQYGKDEEQSHLTIFKQRERGPKTSIADLLCLRFNRGGHFWQVRKSKYP